MTHLLFDEEIPRTEQLGGPGPLESEQKLAAHPAKHHADAASVKLTQKLIEECQTNRIGITRSLQAQDDDAAKVRVELQDADKQRYAVSVLDSNTGNPLCTVEGELEEQRIEFAPDQTCFAGILGAPVNATLLSGVASFEGEALKLELEVSLEPSAPGATLDGALLYSFEGSR